MNPSISIIIPAYNAEKHLSRCLNSLILQTEKNYEAIIVNDGSSDKTGQIADEYKANDNRFRVIHTRNVGVSKARNVGLDNSNGKYITFLDSDDYLQQNYLETLIKTDEKYDIVCTNSIMKCEESGIALSSINYQCSDYFLSAEENLETIITNGALEYVWSKRYKKEIIDGHNIRFKEDVTIGEDTIFFAEYLAKSNTLNLTNETSYIYMKSTYGASNLDCSFYEKILKANNIIHNILTTKYKKLHNSTIWKKRVFNIYSSFLYYITNCNEKTFFEKVSCVQTFLKNAPLKLTLSYYDITPSSFIIYFLLKHKLIFSVLSFLKLKRCLSCKSE